MSQAPPPTSSSTALAIDPKAGLAVTAASATVKTPTQPSFGLHSHRFSTELDQNMTLNQDGEVLRTVTRLYYCDEMKEIAHAIVEASSGRIELATISTEHGQREKDRRTAGRAESYWSRFPDGYPNLKIDQADQIKWCQGVAFLACFHSPAVIFEQMSAILALPKLMPKCFKLILPFFPTGTMERVQVQGEVATAYTLARMLSTVPQGAKGPAQISIFDIHALANQFYFSDSVLIRLCTCIHLLRARLKQLPDYASVNIAFPDDGAHKRFGDMFPSFPNIAICHKVRGEGEKRVVKLKEGDVSGRHMVIVDDLVQSGSTLIECARELKRAGASRVSAFVTHSIFPNRAYLKFTGSDPPLDYFFTTDTNPVITRELQKIGAPFEVMSIATTITEIICDDN